MKISTRPLLLVLATAAIVFCAAMPAAAYNNRNRTVKPPEPKPAVAFTGTVKQVITNSLPYKIVVDGKSNSSNKNAPKGSVTFDVQGTCQINKGDGSGTGKFSDIQIGQTVAISYSSEGTAQYSAQSINLSAKPATTSSAAKKK